MMIFDRVAPFCSTHAEALAWLHGVVAHRIAPVHVVEVGSYKGGSAIVLFDAIRHAGAGSLRCADDFSGMNGKDGRKPFADNVPTEFQENVREYCRTLGGTVREYWNQWHEWSVIVGGHRGTSFIDLDTRGSPAAFQYHSDGIVGLAYIDGDHTYEAVKRDIQALRPKMQPGGIMCGHDLRGEPGVRQAVIECFDRESVLEKPGDLWAVYV